MRSVGETDILAYCFITETSWKDKIQLPIAILLRPVEKTRVAQFYIFETGLGGRHICPLFYDWVGLGHRQSSLLLYYKYQLETLTQSPVDTFALYIIPETGWGNGHSCLLLYY